MRKQALAWLLKSNSVVADEWVCQNLGTGDHSNISRAVGRFRRRKEKPVGLLLAGLLRRRVEAAAMASSRCHENKTISQIRSFHLSQHGGRLTLLRLFGCWMM